jgi:hypothetical protein
VEKRGVPSASRRIQPNHSTARTLAALFGSMPVALALGVALASALPVAAPERTLIGYFAVFPFWAALCLWVFLAPNGKRAGLSLLAVSALLGAALMIEWLGAGDHEGAPLVLPGTR